jgi:hypothetical protein
LVLWAGLAAIVRVVGGRERIGLTWRRLALPVAVVVSAGHMTKGLAKFTSWVLFLPQALRDPAGTATVVSITSKALPEPNALLSLPLVALVGVVLVVAGFGLAVREARLAHPTGIVQRRLLLPKLALAGCFLAILAGWALV